MKLKVINMSNYKKGFIKSLDAVNTFLIYFCIFGITSLLWLLGYLISKGYNLPFIVNDWWRWLIIGLGGLLIIIRALKVLFFDNEEFKDIKHEIRFIWYHAKTAWSVGAGLACIFTGTYFLISANNALHDRYDAIFGIFVSALGITLAAHVLYRNMAPILGTNKLLDSIVEDLKNCPEHSEIWLVYPALNIGFYRALVNKEGVWDDKIDDFLITHRCGKFHRTLRESLEDKHLKAKAITYPKNEYRKLYETYDKMISSEGSVNGYYVDKCTKSAEKLIDLFEFNKSPNIEYIPLAPDQFPQHVIVIGIVVYIIVSYGIPIYNRNLISFIPITGEHEPADLLTWRREDAELARTICDHLRKLTETKTEEHWKHEDSEESRNGKLTNNTIKTEKMQDFENNNIKRENNKI